MKKRDKIYDSPEYKQIKEHLPEILKELERDKGCPNIRHRKNGMETSNASTKKNAEKNT